MRHRVHNANVTSTTLPNNCHDDDDLLYFLLHMPESYKEDYPRNVSPQHATSIIYLLSRFNNYGPNYRCVMPFPCSL